MKKKLFTVILCMMVSGCSQPTVNTDGYTETFGTFYKIKKDNHSFIIWVGSRYGGITHDPDCQCLKTKNEN